MFRLKWFFGLKHASKVITNANVHEFQKFNTCLTKNKWAVDNAKPSIRE